MIGFGAHRFVQLASAHTKVYHYKFSYTGRYSHTYYPADKPFGRFQKWYRFRMRLKKKLWEYFRCRASWRASLLATSSDNDTCVWKNVTRKYNYRSIDWMVDEFRGNRVSEIQMNVKICYFVLCSTFVHSFAVIQTKANSIQHWNGSQQRQAHQNIWKSMIIRQWELFHSQIDMKFGKICSQWKMHANRQKHKWTLRLTAIQCKCFWKCAEGEIKMCNHNNQMSFYCVT